MLNIEEKIPDQLAFVSVQLIDTSGNKFDGQAATREWSSKEAFFRGLKRSSKRIGIILLAMIPLAFIEPFIFMSAGGTIMGLLVFVLGPYLHLRYWAEGISFFFVDSRCPYCPFTGKLTPYLSKAFTERFVVLCPGCGETTRVYQTTHP